MARTNLQIKVGSYTGNGADGRNITGIGFRPDMVWIKCSSTDTNNAVWRTKEMRADLSGFLASSNAGLADRIQELLSDGFQVGTAAQVNSNGEVYQYIAFKGMSSQQYFWTGNYRGTGADNRDFTSGGFSFTPDFVLLQIASAGTTAFRTSTVSGDVTLSFDQTANSVDLIQNLQANGFQLGTGARVNTSGTEYFFSAIKSLNGVIAVGTYTGTGASRSITGIGFQPDVVFIKNQTTAAQARLLTSTMVTGGKQSVYFGSTASTSTGITSLDSTGFTVATDDDVNKSGDTIHWVAFKSGNFNAPLSRLTA